VTAKKNRPKFCANFDNFRLWSRISPERINISKIGKAHENLQSLPRWLNKVCVLRSTNDRVYSLINLHPNGFFFGRLHFGPKGVLRPQIFTCTRDSSRLASAHPKWAGSLQKNFNRENLKFALKFSLLESITSGLVGLSSRNFFSRRARAGVIKWVQILKGPPPKIWEGKKSSKILRDFWQLSTLIANISGADQRIKNLKSSWKSTTTPTLDEKSLYTSVHKRQSYFP